MWLAIGLFATLAALGGAASAEAPGIVTAGLYTPMPTAAWQGLLRVGTIKMKCGCAGKTVQFEVDYCAQAMKLVCVCKNSTAGVECAKARQ
jgi:hypothetical protein